ncbi:MAG: hypothetical protein GX137_05310 [Thermoplasmatales archaeon]|nr:hypothetical protein [Thermoplasmatales archaeon]
MVVKEKRGRRRYVAFRLDPGLRRDDLRKVLRSGSVIQCSEGWAVVRCAPSETHLISDEVRSADPGAESMATSGTLKTLRTRYPELERTRPPKRRR